MKIIRLLNVTAIIAALSACTAQLVSPPGAESSSPYTPVNEKSRGGVVKYLDDGADFVRDKRRNDAYKQMYTACNGKYRIDAEGQKAEGGVVIALGDSATFAPSQYWYIQFSCIP
jgi:hypothetical protein